MSRPSYLLGHSDRELERLGTQARLVNPITRRFFLAAGIAPGMRVLDVGSGAGDTALLAAEMVGPAGEIVGVDRSPEALAVARARTKSLSHVSFREGDLASIRFDRPFDAAVGRYVLMFQADPVAVLRSVAAHVRAGGPIAFHEPDWGGIRSFPDATVYQKACRWIIETIHAVGHEAAMGTKLHATFVAAGLPEPTMGLEALVGGGSNAIDAVDLIADIVESILPAMEGAGVARAAEVEIATLKERMRREVTEKGSVVVGRSEVGAWTRRADH